MTVAGALAILINSAWLVPAAMGVALLYAAYYVVWHFMSGGVARRSSSDVARGLRATVAAPPPTPVATANAPPPISPAPQPVRAAARRSGPTRQQINEAMRDALRQKPWLLRASEVTGSMLMAVLVCVVLGLVTTVATSQNLDGIHRWGPTFAWLVITSVVAAWVILLLGKLWEGSHGDQALRRFWLAVSGMALGTFAGVLANVLALEPTYFLAPWIHVHHSPLGDLRGLYSVTGRPELLAYAGYFGGLFLSVRWWLNADPLRSTRLNVFTTAGTMLMGWIWYFLLPIPRGFMVAAITAIAVQLSAPWVATRKRQHFKEHLLGN
jgi:hypothetical protein